MTLPEAIVVSVVGICLLLLLFCFFMLYRNKRVHDIRIDILERSRWNITRTTHVEYDRLPSYDRMMWQIFKWNFEEVFDDNLYNDIEEGDEIWTAEKRASLRKK